jgi:4-amino-4-deoxy-L-arabinose transferase-like glycosyltransferase
LTIPAIPSGVDRPRFRRAFGVMAVLVPAIVYIAVILARYDGQPYLRGDCQYYYYTAVSIMVDYDLDLGNQIPPPLERHSNDLAVDKRGRLVPKHPIWMSLAALPLILIAGEPGALLFNLIQLLALMLLTFSLARRYASEPAAAAAVMLTGVASFLPHYSWNFSPDVFVTTLLMAALVALPADRQPALGRHFGAGLLLGIVVVSKYSLFLALPGIPLLSGRPARRTLPTMAVGFAVPVILWAMLNIHFFGSPLVTSYDRMATIDEEISRVHSQRSDFDYPLWKGIRNQLLDPKRGLLLTTPITLVSFLGLWSLARRDRSIALYLAGTSVAIFLFFSKYRWWGASHYGSRFLMPLVIFAAVPLAVMIDSLVGWLKTRRGLEDRGVDRVSPDPPPVGEESHEET